MFQRRGHLTISLAIYLRMLGMNLVQASVDGFVNVVLTRASWSRRRCFVEENEETVVGAFSSCLCLVLIAVVSLTDILSDEERMTDVIQVMEDGIATIRKLEGGDPRMLLESFLSMFVSNGFSLYKSRLSFFDHIMPVSIIAADR